MPAPLECCAEYVTTASFRQPSARLHWQPDTVTPERRVPSRKAGLSQFPQTATNLAGCQEVGSGRVDDQEVAFQCWRIALQRGQSSSVMNPSAMSFSPCHPRVPRYARSISASSSARILSASRAMALIHVGGTHPSHVRRSHSVQRQRRTGIPLPAHRACRRPLTDSAMSQLSGLPQHISLSSSNAFSPNSPVRLTIRSAHQRSTVPTAGCRSLIGSLWMRRGF
jgi:hypothetical protein